MNIYKKFDKLWIQINYGVYINFKENFMPSKKINGFIAVSSKEDEEKIKKLSFF